MVLQDKVFALVKKIPSGKVTTYKALADRLGDSKMARAVGNALNKNTDFKNIPCHRIVRSDGAVGGYVLGADKKISKLKKEGIKIRNGKVVDLPKYLYYSE